MKEIEIIEIPLSDCDKLTQLSVEYNDTRYYIGFQQNPKHQNSILFKDLSWIRKHFGVERNEGSLITFDSLNDGRKNEISRYNLAIGLNVPMWELNNWNFEEKRWKTLKERNADREGDKMIRKLSEPDTLSEHGKKQFQKNIDKGLFTLCKIV